jgi:hemoglobin-like flavoprotein
MLPAPIEDAIVATPRSHAKEVVLDRLVKQRVRGRWNNRQARVRFWVFSMLDGQKDHRRISEILHIPEPFVREAIIQLALDHLITMEVREKEHSLNVHLLNDSFKAIKPRGMEFAEHFYTTLFAKGREMLASNEIESLFRKGGNDDDMHKRMKKQYEALLGALAFVIAGVLENKDIAADLVDLGNRHREYGVKDSHYQLVGESLIETLQSYFGPNWTPELEQTWTQAYTLVASMMIGRPGQAA